MSDSNVCYKCRKPGHFARECQESGATGGAERQERRPERRSNEGGDRRRSGGNSNARCYRCNKSGHLARYCEEAAERCYRCNQPGHLAKDCENEVESGKLEESRVFGLFIWFCLFNFVHFFSIISFQNTQTFFIWK